MRVSKTSSVLAMAALLGLTLGSVAEGASDQVPREWKSMSFEDIDVSPFYWGKPWGAICRVGRGWLFGPDEEWCELRITKVPGRGDLLRIGVHWREREPKNCPTPIIIMMSAPCSVRDRVVLVSPIGEAFSDPQESQARMDRNFPPEWRTRILRDIRERIELYAIPCSCGGVPVTPDKAVAQPAPPTSPPRAGGGDSGPPPAEIPGRGVKVPALLGQDPPAATTGGRPGGGPRAMRRTGGFPPDVQVTSLRFFPSPNAMVPRDERAYAASFDDRVEYVNLELNLAYPARTERFPFEMEITVLKDGREFTTFTQTDLSLEPGWTDSFHNAGWGKDGGGAWPPGRYRVEVSVKGVVVATGEFGVVGSR